jgi:hypothetical protein
VRSYYTRVGLPPNAVVFSVTSLVLFHVWCVLSGCPAVRLQGVRTMRCLWMVPHRCPPVPGPGPTMTWFGVSGAGRDSSSATAVPSEASLPGEEASWLCHNSVAVVPWRYLGCRLGTWGVTRDKRWARGPLANEWSHNLCVLMCSWRHHAPTGITTRTVLRVLQRMVFWGASTSTAGARMEVSDDATFLSYTRLHSSGILPFVTDSHLRGKH